MKILHTASLKTTKQGNEDVGTDDAIFPPVRTGTIAIPPRHTAKFAIADGASGAVCSGAWARILTRAYVRGLLGPETSDWPWECIVQLWTRKTSRRLQLNYGSQLPWYAAEMLSMPAQAAFLGLRISWMPPDQISWEVAAIGDCCIAHVTEDRLRQMFPLEAASSFGNRPRLVPASVVHGPQIEPPLVTGACLWPGDRLYLMTDAIAAWFAEEAASSRKPWTTLDEALTLEKSQVTNWACTLRSRGALKNDDVTVCRISLTGTE